MVVITKSYFSDAPYPLDNDVLISQLPLYYERFFASLNDQRLLWQVLHTKKSPIVWYMEHNGIESQQDLEMSLLPRNRDDCIEFLGPENSLRAMGTLGGSHEFNDYFMFWWYSKIHQYQCIIGRCFSSFRVQYLQKMRRNLLPALRLQYHDSDWLCVRNTPGKFIEAIRTHPETFLFYMQVPVNEYDHLLDTLRKIINFGDRDVSEDEKLAMLLLALGDQKQRAISWLTGRSISTVNRVIREMVSLVSSLSSRFIKPMRPGVIQVPVSQPCSPSFCFRDCFGAVGGTHVACLDRRGTEPDSDFIGKESKKTFNNLVVVSLDGFIQYVHAGAAGSEHDSRLWKQTIANNKFIIPEGQFIIADLAFGLTHQTLPPYKGWDYYHNDAPPDIRRFRDWTVEKKYNFVHASLRNIVERTFAELKNKFAILKRANHYDQDMQEGIFLSCCVIYNIHKLVNHPEMVYHYVCRCEVEHLLDRRRKIPLAYAAESITPEEFRKSITDTVHKLSLPSGCLPTHVSNGEGVWNHGGSDELAI